MCNYCNRFWPISEYSPTAGLDLASLDTQKKISDVKNCPKLNCPKIHCGQEFTGYKKLIKHLARGVHGGQVKYVTCDICGESFRSDNLRFHNLAFHDEFPKPKKGRPTKKLKKCRKSTQILEKPISSVFEPLKKPKIKDFKNELSIPKIIRNMAFDCFVKLEPLNLKSELDEDLKAINLKEIQVKTEKFEKSEVQNPKESDATEAIITENKIPASITKLVQGELNSKSDFDFSFIQYMSETNSSNV